MTERRRVEEQLRDANRRLEDAVASERQAQQSLLTAQSTMVQTEKLAGLGQMVAGVAHEINNPLSFVSNNVAVLQRDLRGLIRLVELYRQANARPRTSCADLAGRDSRPFHNRWILSTPWAIFRKLLTRSRDGLKRIQQIVKDLRDFARLDESDLQEVSLNEGIQSTVTIINGHAKKHDVRIVTDFGQLPLVTCFPAKVNQVVMNLLTNAIDATPANGQVTLRTRANDADSVRIEVTDTGQRDRPGDPRADFRSLFHDQAAGTGHRAGAEHQLWNRPRSQRDDRSPERAGQRGDVPRDAAGESAKGKARWKLRKVCGRAQLFGQV